MKKLYTLITRIGVYDLDGFTYEKFYTLHNGCVSENKALFYEELEAVLEKFKTYNSKIGKSLYSVVVTEYILEGPDLCAGFSEDKEMNRLVAPLSSESLELAIELCREKLHKRKENKNEKSL